MKKFLVGLLISVCTFNVMSAFAASDISGYAKDSFFNLSGKWKNQNGEVVKLDKYQGKYLVVSMVYTSCAYSCPRTVSKVKEIEEKMKSAGLKNYHVVLASFDVKKDRPEKLKDFMTKKSLNEDVWTMLSADQDETVRELAVVLGLSYKETEDGEFSHSNVIAVLDPKGVLVDKLTSLSASDEGLIKKVKDLSAAK